MKPEKTPKAPWITRFAIRLFTFVLAVLIFWALGFLLQDIRSIRGPQRSDIEKKYVDQKLVSRSHALAGQSANLERTIGNQREEQRIMGDRSKNLQRTIDQLVELQKLSLQKDIALSEEDQSNLTVHLNRFLESQNAYHELNRDISELTGKMRTLEEEKRGVDHQIAEQRKLAREEYDGLREAHRLKLAAYQLVILIPLLLAGAYLVIGKRLSTYFPLFLAFSVATLVRVTLVIHEYFPTRYFRYILILALLLAVARMLIHFIRVVAFPKAQWLTKQYREAYERFLCPVCEYPIRIGPRRFLYWTRRTVHKTIPQNEASGTEETYTCPSCGTSLFETCSACQKIRHALLPCCRHCGAESEPSP